MYRKAIVFLLGVALVLGMAACGQKVASDAAWQEQYDLGVRYLSEGNYQEAIIAFTAAIEIDPKRADAYLSLADAYAAVGDIDAAREALQRGYDATADEALQDRLELAGLTVLTRQETLRFEDGWSIEYTFAYNDAGYLICQEEQSNDDKGNASASVSTWEYNAEANRWQCYQDGVLDEEQSGWHQRGTSTTLREAGNILATPFPTEFDGIIAEGEYPARVERYSDPAYAEFYSENMWHTADYHYDAQGNAVRIDSYNAAGEFLGYCLLEWAVFLPDGSLVPLDGTARPEPPERTAPRVTEEQAALLEQVIVLMEAKDWQAAADFILDNGDALVSFHNDACNSQYYLYADGGLSAGLEGAGLVVRAHYVSNDPAQSPAIHAYYGSLDGGKPEGSFSALYCVVEKDQGRMYQIADSQHWSGGKPNGEAMWEQHRYEYGERYSQSGVYRNGWGEGEITMIHVDRYGSRTYVFTASEGKPVIDDRWIVWREDRGRKEMTLPNIESGGVGSGLSEETVAEIYAYDTGFWGE